MFVEKLSEHAERTMRQDNLVSSHLIIAHKQHIQFAYSQLCRRWVISNLTLRNNNNNNNDRLTAFDPGQPG